MRKRLFAIVYSLLLVQFVSTAAVAENAASPSEPLWRFETHG